MYKDEKEYNQDDECPETRGKKEVTNFEELLEETYKKFPFLKDIEFVPDMEIIDEELEPYRLPDFGRFEPNRRIPHRCPICNGKGKVPNGFYDTTEDVWSSTSLVPETCRSCGGSGYILI